jgi:hypothetical protein
MAVTVYTNAMHLSRNALVHQNRDRQGAAFIHILSKTAPVQQNDRQEVAYGLSRQANDVPRGTSQFSLIILYVFI